MLFGSVSRAGFVYYSLKEIEHTDKALFNWKSGYSSGVPECKSKIKNSIVLWYVNLENVFILDEVNLSFKICPIFFHG